MPLSISVFNNIARDSIEKFSNSWLNEQQEESVLYSHPNPLFIVAGPGTGKTTVLALRALKHIFVDGINPDEIVATTFTKKAARELRSRILLWGYAIQEFALNTGTLNAEQQAWLKSIDINQIVTGTLDSISQELLSQSRSYDEIQYTIIEDHYASWILKYKIARERTDAGDNIYHPGDDDLRDFISVINCTDKKMLNEDAIIGTIKTLCDRRYYDLIDIDSFAQKSIGHAKAINLISRYNNYLLEYGLMDFALLEFTVLDRVKSGRLRTLTDKIRVLLVDEFQDTNALQESIYYEICKNSTSPVLLTVVGDDDQSIYRFRGATVEIFSNFETRIASEIGPDWAPYKVYLVKNYRSTDRIVGLANHYIMSEPSFLPSRTPGKPPIEIGFEQPETLPIIGLFRADINSLARAITGLLMDVFRGDGFEIEFKGGQKIKITRGENGDLGDSVLLSRSVAEQKENGEYRLSGLLRQLLTPNNIPVFNPRGREIGSIPEVSILLGLLLKCLDPEGIIQYDALLKTRDNREPSRVRKLANAKMQTWRVSAQQFIAANPSPGGLPKFVTDWGTHSTEISAGWPKSWPLQNLLFTCITWLPYFQRVPEGQIYMEAISRAITNSEQTSSYGSEILSAEPHRARSIKHLINDVFVPLATESVSPDEDIMEYVPRNFFPIMTIHQAKGLEFPLVFLDVGSDFKTDHHTQRRFRFPTEGESVHRFEDLVSDCSPIGSLRSDNSPENRAFDDIRRLYYVGKTRPQQVLILVGLESVIQHKTVGKKADRIIVPSVPAIQSGVLRDLSRTYEFIPANEWSFDKGTNVIALI